MSYGLKRGEFVYYNSDVFSWRYVVHEATGVMKIIF